MKAVQSLVILALIGCRSGGSVVQKDIDSTGLAATGDDTGSDGSVASEEELDADTDVDADADRR